MQRIAACGSAWLERLLDAFSPPSCAACGGPRRGPPPFCITCGAPAPLLLPATLGGVPLVVAGRYQAPLSKAVQRFKFEGRSELATDLARLLVPRLRALELGDACFVPVPLHRARLVERGYNQSALLARCLARGVGGHAGVRVLSRQRATEQQARLGRHARLDNVADAFRPWRGAVPQRSVLVDDVVTTGATALACLETLKKAGSEVLLVVALARAEGSG
jgi:ComF family protein